MSNAAKDLLEYQKHAAIALTKHLDNALVNVEHESVLKEDVEEEEALPLTLVLYGKICTREEPADHQKDSR